MFHVYILRSKKTSRYYVGSTQDVSNRLREHNSGESLSTRSGIPWELVWAEEFGNRSEAVQRERQIKARGIGRFLGRLLEKGPG